MNDNNLRALAKLLRELVDPKHFHMGYYLADDDRHEFEPGDANRERYHECGTVACALGHAPLLFPSVNDGSWQRYCERVFGCSTYGDNPEAFEFFFSGSWKHADNTPQGAAARIEYYLRTGTVPSRLDTTYMQSKRVPLCYA